MKTKSVVFSACSAFALLASPAAFAQEADAKPDVSPDEKVEIVVEDPTEDVGEVAGDDDSANEDGEIPIEWLQRDRGEVTDPVIYQMYMSGGGAAATSPEKTAKSDSAERIEAPVTIGKSAIVKGHGKGPVALVKGGRVFLR